jgi:hypothetical protein
MIINSLANIFMGMARKKKPVATHGHSTSVIAIEKRVIAIETCLRILEGRQFFLVENIHVNAYKKNMK